MLTCHVQAIGRVDNKEDYSSHDPLRHPAKALPRSRPPEYCLEAGASNQDFCATLFVLKEAYSYRTVRSIMFATSV